MNEGKAGAFIRSEGLTKSFGHIRALRGVDLTVRAGESWLILGPNGAGKTTLMGILSLLLKPTEGELSINGKKDAESETALRQEIGVISHETFLYGDLTAQENLIFYGKLYGIADCKGSAVDMIKEVGLEDWAHERVRNYSRGMQQRLAIARAMLHRPSILLLDEPYTGLDQHGVLNFQNMLNRYHTDERITIMTSHNLSAGFEKCTHLAILAGGKIVFSNPMGELNSGDLKAIYFNYVEKTDR
ncbi:hypothetical protein LCGC14_1757200 [marine sediment metagenome]|uniref:ABC transporter domain-containing protein n=1 Tax=marine sediment metagenome TaxID=412755 RepID=A0A0F9JH86_9ZZZZ|nr:heme ABC exporter ATP-binding protein CcmA [Spirochaetota bacterium]